MNGGVAPAMATAVVGSNLLATGSQKRKRGLAPTKKLAAVERPALPSNGFAVTRLQDYESKTLVCVLCADRKHELVELRKHPEIKRILMSFAELPSQSFEGVEALVCVQCILKVNVQQDMRRQMKDKIKRLVNGQAKPTATPNKAAAVAAATNNISAKKPLTSFPKKVKRKMQSSPTNSCYSDQGAVTLPKDTTPELSQMTTLTSSHIVSPRNCMPTSTENSEEALFQQTTRTAERDSSPLRRYSPPIHRRRYSNEPITLPDSATKSPPSAVTVPATPATLRDQKELEKLKQQPHSKTAKSVSNGSYVTRISRYSPTRSVSPNAQNHSMLDVVYERKESALITESGGKINHYGKVDEAHAVRSPPQQFICKTCQRSYQRKHFYSKHVRRCRPRAQSDARSTAGKSMRLSTTEGDIRHFVFHCSVCPVTVDSLSKLRKHRRIHLTRFYCPTCGQEFNALQDYEFHCIECLAKQVSVELQPTAQLEQRVTRSRSRAASLAATHVEHKRHSENFSNQMSESEHDETEFDDVEQSVSSLADTMYTKRMHYTDHWLQEHSIGAADNESLSGNYIDYDEYLDINTDKEYDLYLLDRLKMEITLGSLSCFVPLCEFRGNSVPHLMLHEFCDHLQRLLFHCKKCGESFTRKVHLDFHLYCQNGGRYICYKCGDVFEFQDQLDRHLLRHTKVVNYCCRFCNFEFLTKAELLEHCKYERHDPNGERELISIVRSMTIENPVPPSPAVNDQRRQYKVHFMEMHLPRLPYNPQISKPFRRPKAGDLRFKGQMHPNCCSCVLYVKDFDSR